LFFFLAVSVRSSQSDFAYVGKKKKFTVFTPYFYGQPTTCVGNFEWEMKKKKRINRVVEVEAKSAWENETEKR
jgi:hypothetical protein